MTTWKAIAKPNNPNKISHYVGDNGDLIKVRYRFKGLSEETDEIGFYERNNKPFFSLEEAQKER